jgi:hypothetical protein
MITRLNEAKAKIGPEMDAKYDGALQTLASTTDQASALQALELLAKWTPKGRPN